MSRNPVRLHLSAHLSAPWLMTWKGLGTSRCHGTQGHRHKLLLEGDRVISPKPTYPLQVFSRILAPLFWKFEKKTKKWWNIYKTEKQDIVFGGDTPQNLRLEGTHPLRPPCFWRPWWYKLFKEGTESCLRNPPTPKFNFSSDFGHFIQEIRKTFKSFMKYLQKKLLSFWGDVPSILPDRRGRVPSVPLPHFRRQCLFRMFR